MKRLLPLLLCLVVSLSANAENEPPELIVKQTIDAVLDVLSNDGISERVKRNNVFTIVKQRINFTEMSRRVLATNWRKASEAQREAFITKFETIILQSYWVRIRNYAGEQVEYISASYDNTDYVTVDTVIVKNNNVQIPISYRMRRFVDIWFAYDFIVEQLSLVQSYRNEYQAIVKNQGVDGLLEYMQKDIDSYAIKK